MQKGFHVMYYSIIPIDFSISDLKRLNYEVMKLIIINKLIVRQFKREVQDLLNLEVNKLRISENGI